MKKMIITEEEKSRILGIHTFRTKNHYLMEEPLEMVGGISDRKGDLYATINNVIDEFEGVDDSDIISVLENILSHHKGRMERSKRPNGGYITSDEVRKNFSR